MQAPLISLDLNFEQFNSLKVAIPVIADHLQQKQNELNQAFHQQADIYCLLQTRAHWIDSILKYIWQALLSDAQGTCLVAVGGFGYQRLHPGSDVDILILQPEMWHDPTHKAFEFFIACCWDCGIKLSPSIRSVDECIKFSQHDLSIYTTLLSHRLVAGDASCYQDLKQAIDSNEKLWSFQAFFTEKIKERNSRILRFQSSEYNLEPNLKDAPGTLRDLDLVRWLSQKKYHDSDFKTLVLHGDIEKKEYQVLIQGQRFLWHLRYALHLVSKPPTERLFFEYQEKLAKDAAHLNLNDAVSQMMQKFFQITHEIRTTTDVLCQHFHESFITANSSQLPLPSHCQLRGEYLDVMDLSNLDGFRILQLIYFIVQHHLKGFSAKTTRALFSIVETAPADFFNNELARSAFLALLNTPRFASNALNLMHRYNLLSLYIPQFKHITGQMQYDLYHIYTVDAHTLKLIENIADLFDTGIELKPLKPLPQSPILILAGLFHDISKGQGGNHAVKGKAIAQFFCEQHGILPEQTELVVWLVENHLLMSATAQKKDISDTHIITEFARILENEIKLTYLYILTIADIQATNPSLWNHWRKSLLLDLYKVTLNWFNEKHAIADPQSQSLKTQLLQTIAQRHPTQAPLINILWQGIDDHYFNMYNSHQIVQQSDVILDFVTKGKDYALAFEILEDHAGTEIFIYAKDSPELFSLLSSAMERLLLTIAQARITRTNNGYTLQTYMVMQASMQPLTLALVEAIKQVLNHLLENYTQGTIINIPGVKRHIPRQIKHFSKRIPVTVTTQLSNQKTVIEVVAPDFPGLLARIASVFVQNNVLLHHAKINTLGQRVEDVFYVTNTVYPYAPLSEESAHILEGRIKEILVI